MVDAGFDFGVVEEALWVLAQGLLVVGLPVVVKAFLEWLGEKVRELRGSLSEAENERIEGAIRIGVAAAEQLKANGLLPDGAAAKGYALDVIGKELDRNGIVLDADLLMDRVEYGYRMFRSQEVFQRQELVGQAVDVGVRAWRESGLAGEAKGFVERVAKGYLRDFGVSVDVDVLEALVLGRLGELKQGG